MSCVPLRLQENRNGHLDLQTKENNGMQAKPHIEVQLAEINEDSQSTLRSEYAMLDKSFQDKSEELVLQGKLLDASEESIEYIVL